MTDGPRPNAVPDAAGVESSAPAAVRAGDAARAALLPPGADPGVPLPLLADPAGYRACEHDLLTDAAGRAYWLDLFATHIDVQLEHARAAGLLGPGDVAPAAASMRAAMDIVAGQPDLHGRLDILVLDSIRRRVLSAAGADDEFRQLKARENERALAGLAGRCARLDAMAPEPRVLALMQGLLAGNLFDMGARATAARFAGAPPAFDAIVGELPPRPWHVDHVDAVTPQLVRPPRRTLILVDNAGADVVLGALPLARAIVHAGGRVDLVANAVPALNDVTAAELRGLLTAAARIDPLFASDSIRVVDSGSAAPLIDLATVSEELATAAGHPDVGLLVLLGMGRGVESNWSAAFTVPTLRVAMLKDPQVASRLGAELPDAVVRFDPATPRVGAG
jgi:type II pantothenate kinase